MFPQIRFGTLPSVDTTLAQELFGHAVSNLAGKTSAGVLRADEVQVFYEGRSKPILSFDGTQETSIYPEENEVRVVLLANYPAGPHWKWTEVRVAEWRFTAKCHDPHPRPLFHGIRVTPDEIDSFVDQYRRWIESIRQGAARGRNDAEEMLGRLALAATAGNKSAQRLLRSAHEDAHLDGAAGEEFEYYWYNYGLVHPGATRNSPRGHP